MAAVSVSQGPVEEAIRKLKAHSLAERALAVNTAKPREPRRSGGRGMARSSRFNN